jgi:branched-chain amino acid aminotransferase
MPMKNASQIWFNGKFVPWEQAQVHVFTHAIHYGSSVFEGIRAYDTANGTAVWCLPQHMDRMYLSARMYHMVIPYSKEDLTKAVVETVRASGMRSCYIRPIAFRGYETIGVDPRGCPVDVAIGVIDWGRYLGPEAIEQGVRVCISSWRRMAPDTVPALAKIGGHYTNSQLMVMEAKQRGFDEAVALDVAGYVSEGPGENIFLVWRDVLYTPPLGSSILMGITRDCVITLARELGYEVREQAIPREMLYVADEVFFSGTAVEISPIRSVDDIQVGPGHRGPVTKRLQEEFFGITDGSKADRHGWLTYLDKA